MQQVKKEIHPDYHPVVFRDIGADYSFLTRSTATSNQTVKWEDGNEYPSVSISCGNCGTLTGLDEVINETK